MKKTIYVALLCFMSINSAFSQSIVANPFVNSASFIPSQVVGCGASTVFSFQAGLSTPNDFPLVASSPEVLIVSISNAFEFNGASPTSFVSGSYASNFNWSLYSSTSLIGVQKNTLPGIGSNPSSPNPLASGMINIGLKLKQNVPNNASASALVNLSSSVYMSLNYQGDDATSSSATCNCAGISGKIYNDTTCSQQGNDDGIVNGPVVPFGKAYNNLDPSPNNIPNDTALYVSLVDSSNTVLQIDSLDANGVFDFSFVTPQRNYFVQISTTKGVVGNLAPPITFPYSWFPTGESNYNFPISVDNQPNGRLLVPINSNAVSNNRFGIWSPPPNVKVSGNVYNDVNGAANIDGVPVSTPGNSPLYVSLISNTNNVVKTATVAQNGTFEVTNVIPNKTYSIVLSTINGTIGNPAPNVALPFGWSHVGEDCCDYIGNDGLANGITTVNVGTTDVSLVKFGIFEPMSIGNQVWNDLNRDGLYNNNEPGLANAVVQLFTDANQDNIPDGVSINLSITDSTGAYLFDGLAAGSYIVQVTPSPPTQGPNFISTYGAGEESNPNLNGNNNDNGIVTIGNITRSNYVILAPGTEPTNDNQTDNSKPDNNGNESIDFGFYQPISISGNVFVDVNGPSNVDGTPIGIIDSSPLFISLVDNNGMVLSSKAVSPNGTYTIDSLIGNRNYEVVLSTIQGNVGNAVPAVSFPVGWLTSSEDCCDNTGNDGLPNSKLNIALSNLNVVNANFGITCNYTFSVTDTFCNQDVIDLTQYEPFNSIFAGGAWSHSNPNINVSNPIFQNIDSGIYSYMKTSNYYGCIASGTLNAMVFAPDYAALLYALSGAVQGPTVSSLDVLLNVTELSNTANCDSVFLYLPRNNGRITAVFDSNLVTGVPGFTQQVNNPEWVLDTSNPTYYLWIYKGNNSSYQMPAGASSWLKFTALYNSQGTSGQTSMSIQVYQSNGAEDNISNNFNSVQIVFGGY